MAVGRGGKIGIIVGVVVVVVLGALLVVDRVGESAAERKISEQAAQQLKDNNITAPKQPKTQIAGFPFLTQVASGKYQKITITVDKPSTQGVTLDNFVAVAHDVRAKASDLMHGRGPVTADKVTGTGHLPWDQVTKLITLTGVDASNVTISADDQGKITAKLPVSLLSLSTTVVITGTVTVADGKASVTVDQVSAEGGNTGPLLNSLLAQVKQALSIQIGIPKLPYNLVVTGMKSASDGLTLTAESTNVSLVK
jgi:hypothetical protein